MSDAPNILVKIVRPVKYAIKLFLSYRLLAACLMAISNKIFYTKAIESQNLQIIAAYLQQIPFYLIHTYLLYSDTFKYQVVDLI